MISAHAALPPENGEAVLAIHVGVDIGSTSVRVAVCSGDPRSQRALEALVADSSLVPVVMANPTGCHLVAAVAPSERLSANPLAQVKATLHKLMSKADGVDLGRIAVTGGGADGLVASLGGDPTSEVRALVAALDKLVPDARTVIEIGGETSRFVRLEPQSSGLAIVDYHTNGDCAAGTGSFLDQQARRLRFDIADVGRLACQAGRAAKIAGRCSVFAKSDMIHAQQMGFLPEEILKGLCEAVARNYRSAIIKGRRLVPRVVFLGGPAANPALVEALAVAVDLDPTALMVPEHHASFLAIGAALEAQAKDGSRSGRSRAAVSVAVNGDSQPFGVAPALSMEKVLLLRDRMPILPIPLDAEPVVAYLGIDVGSVSTNLVVINSDGAVLSEVYLRTEGRPIEAVSRGLRTIEDQLGNRISLSGVGTTGSGRELIAELIGADVMKDEITAHKTGASIIDRSLLGLGVDTIFEIGGQDAKFISLQDGVVVDFAMNEACAAGTGSFLEERAAELGVRIEGQFAQLALASRSPVRLGERCTVFMEKDVNTGIRRGIHVQDLAAGLAYSVATNYINRVVRGRKIGKVVFFQGGTAYNDAVAAALSQILDVQIIVPPFNGVMGALGMAHIAKSHLLRTGVSTGFRGLLDREVPHSVSEFSCQACSNECRMQRFTVAGEHSYWGDKCGVKFRKKSRGHEPLIDDLAADRQKKLLQLYAPGVGSGPVIGLPFALSTYDWAPFWFAVLGELGLSVLLSEPTSNHTVALGAESTVSEPCFPIAVALGHVRSLFDRQADFVLVPNYIAAPGDPVRRPSFFCPWNQTLPFVARAAPSIADHRDRILAPTLWFNHGHAPVSDAIRTSFATVGLRFTHRQVRRAVQVGFDRLLHFREDVRASGRRAVAELDRGGAQGIVLLGRGYNVYDRGVNLDIAAKLRRYYGANVIGFDALDVADHVAAHYEDATYWSSGSKLLAAAAFTRDHPNLHLIYITNFKCGPDSYLKHYVRDACGRPFLTLQFDGHNNDAGMLTRCEAYLESKGALV